MRVSTCRATPGPVTRAACRDAVAGLVERYGAVLPSALQSLRRGRRTEIPYLNGYLADKAAAIGRPAPLNARIAKMIEEIESGQRAMGPVNIEALLS